MKIFLRKDRNMITETIRTNLDDELEHKCKQANIPGMVLIASHKGKWMFEKYYGYRDVEKQLPVTCDTVFGVASITKSFACLAIMQLVDAKKLCVNDPVQKWIPQFELPGNANSSEVTIHHLMTHTAGLPGLSAVHEVRAESIKRDPDGEYLFEEIPKSNLHVRTVTQMMETIAESKTSVIGEPGEMFNYSNESYAILQEIIERASGESFLDYMDHHVFDPLEMTRATFLTEELAKMDDVTELYAYSKDEDRHVFHSPAWWDVGEIYTNGSLKASAADLMNYLEVYRQKGIVDGEEILSKESVKMMTHPHVTTPNDIQYGYGLTIGQEAGVQVFGHGGGIKGVSSFMLVAPKEELTICVLINIAEAAAEDMALTAMKHLLQLQEEQEEDQTYELSMKEAKRYIGKYESAEGQKVHVLRSNDDTLTIRIDHNEIRLKPIGQHTFLTPDGKKVVFIEKDHEIIAIFRGLRYIEKIS